MEINEKLIKSIEGKKRELDKLRPFPPSVVRRLNEEFTIEWTYNSNAIEGNTLSLQETELVINRGITIGGKSLQEHFEAINHVEAIKLIKDFIDKREDLSEVFILRVHEAILKNIDDLEAGKYRRHNVRIMGAIHLPPNAVKVKKLMNEMVAWYHENNHILSIPELAALMHYKLVNIHPFMDGNGRTARLLMNFILIRNGYPPAVILNVDRKRYYRVLKDADAGELEEFLNFVGKAIERSLIIYLNAITQPDEEHYEKQGYIPLKDAAKYCEYSQEYLSFLARTGRLSAVKFNRNWMTTRNAVEEYIRNMKREKNKIAI